MPLSALRIGQDLVDVARLGRALEGKEERFQRRVFTEEEWARSSARPDRVAALAARFAAKEAAFKALGTGWSDGVAWRDVEVLGGSPETPVLALHGKAAEIAQAAGLVLTVSLTHTEELAAAMVLAYRA